MPIPSREPLHQAPFLIHRDEGNGRGFRIAQECRQRTQLLRWPDILRIEDHPADRALVELLARQSNPGIALAVATETNHDHLSYHGIEQRVGRRLGLDTEGGRRGAEHKPK